MTKPIDISVIIVNYKGWSYLRDCLKSLIDIPESTFTFEIIVIDNCSDDGNLSKFQTDFKSVNFYKNTGNNGFANACNFGAAKANGKYLLFLNPDTIANAEALEKMLKTAKINPDIGALSCVQVNQKGALHDYKKVFLSLGTLFGFFRIFYRIINKNSLKKQFNTSKEIVYPDWISGSVVFISRTWFEKVGGWCDDYWMCFEDVDLCKRLSDKGAKIAMLQNVTIKHYHGGSSRINYSVKALTKSEVIKSRHVYIHKYFKGKNRFLMQLISMKLQLFSKLIFGILGVLFFFIKSAPLHRKLFKEIYLYYFSLPFTKAWLSKRSVNYKA
ncbi:MAG: glycosyltransferase family 2 protein [Flavobacteriaceae bacterium]